jgi:hypothetical protein
MIAAQPAPETMERYVDASEEHDEFLMSIALLTEALASFVASPESGEVRPRAMDEGEGRYEQDGAAFLPSTTLGAEEHGTETACRRKRE